MSFLFFCLLCFSSFSYISIFCKFFFFQILVYNKILLSSSCFRFSVVYHLGNHLHHGIRARFINPQFFCFCMIFPESEISSRFFFSSLHLLKLGFLCSFFFLSFSVLPCLLLPLLCYSDKNVHRITSIYSICQFCSCSPKQ